MACGIAGIYGKSDNELIRKMLFVISHRGPDDEYYVSGEDFSLGARRLSIIDLEGGRQPQSNENSTVWVVQNGEIYNFPELRKELSKRHTFKSRSDTEVLVHLYEDYGESFVNFVNGMFAIAIWDVSKNKGVLVRDRVGKKPLYYCVQDNHLYFASEIKSLLQIPSLRRKVNLEALHYYLSYKHVPCPLSIFEGIYQLSPAHILIYEPRSDLKLLRYWNLNFSNESNREVPPEEVYIEKMNKTLTESVRKRLISDVPMGFFLSGGTDSGLLVAIASALSREPIETFTLTYPAEMRDEGKKKDEEYARRISQMYGTKHHELMIDFRDFTKELPKIIQQFDEPFSGVMSTYFLSELLHKYVKVAISGDGCDELFGSYLSHRLSFPIHNLLEFRKKRSKEHPNLKPFEKDVEFLERIAEQEQWKWRYKLLVFTDKEKEQLYSTKLTKIVEGYDTLEHLRGYYSELTADDPLNRTLEAEFHSFFPDQVLTFVDRLSMAHSLEIRAPYLDYEFVELAAQIPGMLKIKNGETKYILKRLALRYLPEEIVYRKKEGFLLPISFWLRYKLEDYVRTTLCRSRLEKHGFFNADYVQKLVDDFYLGEENWQLANKIFTLLVFQIWYELYIEGLDLN